MLDSSLVGIVHSIWYSCVLLRVQLRTHVCMYVCISSEKAEEGKKKDFFRLDSPGESPLLVLWES